jgi:hypothetical protein
MEPVFEIPYLIGVVALGVWMLRLARGRKDIALFGVMAVTLGCGDAFHLVPRVWFLVTAGTAGLPGQAAALGFGKQVTSVTMTVFYGMLYRVWQLRYRQRNRGLTVCVYGLAALRVLLCLLPQNQWQSPDAPLAWGIYRNIPFALLGLVMIGLYAWKGRECPEGREAGRAFRFMWLAVALSFLFYIPVVLFADAVPLVGMLMLPKTCAYVWIVWMGLAAAKASPGTAGG